VEYNSGITESGRVIAKFKIRSDFSLRRELQLLMNSSIKNVAIKAQVRTFCEIVKNNQQCSVTRSVTSLLQSPAGISLFFFISLSRHARRTNRKRESFVQSDQLDLRPIRFRILEIK